MTTKKVISILLICTLLLCGCSSVTQYDSTSSQLEKGITESTEETANHQDPLDEDERFLELFEVCYEEYKQKGLGCRMEYAELEDIWQANSDNEMMRNLYYFCNACGYYWLADITDDEGLKSNGNSEAAKIDPNYDGPYADEVITFAKELLGESYEEEAARAVEAQRNYDNLSMMDKVDILNMITESTSQDADELWEEIAYKYGISTSHVSLINNDYDVIKAAGEARKAKSEIDSTDIKNDAILSYGSGDVVVADTIDDLDDFLTCVAKNDNNTISQMILSGRIAYVKANTKVNIVEYKYSVIKVRILEGIYQGVECWTIMEAVQKVG